ncbi:EsaB/YukD family protein [Microbacterium sp. M3]|uniref:EsaB/YukD family protein n=2 Tax=Microbacterium arthrosphaerae TaxID=792652 RepID=A0ABU4H3V5_9MICO|nr:MULTISPECIES: EsaB/YukD family protein [Microbacterium]MDW4574017.1 EsaB/YukD family protein [Microbacterium arthrosphaerae]MDW7607872.1 EsaB/YukD family protein [Microbacterium sp. M3]
MSVHTRLTVAGATRRSEVVVSSAEPLGAALPRLLELLGETSGTVARPLTLVAADGEQLDIARSPQQLELTDGTLLRLVRLDAAPPPPVVIDVTDAAADAHDARPDRWDDRARRIAGGAAIALAAAAGGLIAPWGSPVIASWALLGAIVVLLAVATTLGLPRLRGVSAVVSAAAAGLLLPLGIATLTAASAGGLEGAASALLAAAVVIATGATIVLFGLGVALRRPGAAAGGAVGAVVASVLIGLLLAGVDAAASAAIVGTVAAFATGPLPWIALSAAGLTALDQRVGDGERVARARAFASIDDAYSALTWSVVTLAALLAATGVALVLTDELWSGLLALAFALVAALRARAFPLRVQVWALWAAVAAIGLVALLLHLSGPSGWLGAAVAAAAAVVVAIGVLARPAAHVRARLRGFGNVIETLAVVALLPLLLGALGVYEQLLGMFGGGA